MTHDKASLSRRYRDASADLINLLDCHEVAVILDRFRGGREIISVARPEMASHRVAEGMQPEQIVGPSPLSRMLSMLAFGQSKR
jgi:hypothetical protein